MASYNKVILMGNLVADPETRVTPGGLTICKFRIAVNRTYNDRDGNRQEEVTYVDIDSFGKPAEVISRYMSKGRPIMVEGRLRLDTWEQEGQKRSKMVVVCENFQFMGGRDDASSGGGGGYEDSSPPPRQQQSRRPQRAQQAPPSQPPPQDDFDDDDVPF